MVGQTISHYKILEKIGEGGMGVVFKAEDTKLKRTVALKFLPRELIRDSEAKERFIQEARAAAALDHPHICTVHEINEAKPAPAEAGEGKTFIAMAYIEGQSLKEKIKSGPIEIGEALDIAAQVAEGLQEAHEKGIIHRDIKPGNIMITGKGQAKIMDFGLAKLEWGADLTKTATVMGTIAYMSPEQARGEKVDHRTDIWSLGAMFYEMLTGERPFKSTHDQAAIYEILNEEPQPISKLRKEVPEGFEQIIRKALGKDRPDRYQTASDFLSDLRYLKERVHAGVSGGLASESKPSIAVMPFVDMSPQKDQEYFCDGIAEELINALTHIKDLHVVARTSAFSFKGAKLDVREIGKKLDVNTVLEGSIRKAGSRVRITSQLINVADGYHLWSEKFDRELDDIFAIQDEISLAIVDNLKVKLLKKEKEAVLKRHTDNIEAYNLYLKGVYFLRMYTPEGFKKAIEYFNHALQEDPNFALLYSGLAEVFYAISYWGNVSPRDSYPKAKAYVNKALKIDDTLGEAHAALGLIHTFFDWDWKKAEQELLKALQLNPNAAWVRMSYSWFLTLRQRHEEAIHEAKQAQELDPLSSNINAHVGFALFLASRFDRAIEELQAALTMDPNFFLSHYYLSLVYRVKSMFERGIQENEKAVELSGGASWVTMMLATAYFEAGKTTQGEELFESLRKRSRQEYLPPLGFFYIHLYKGHKDQAFEWLKKACDERDSFLPWCVIIPKFIIPDEPGFNALLKKAGLGR
ncbi:MAG: protein kinase domain-containing protein [Candidatus Aminicenantes bacterium]